MTINLRDKLILEQLIEENASVEAVAEMTGLDEIDVVRRAKKLLNAKDVFTVLEQKQMLVYQLKGLYARARHLLDTFTDSKSWPKGVEAITKLIETTYKIQVEQDEQNAKEMDRLTQAQGVVLVQVVQAAYNRARELLVKEYPEVDASKLDDAFATGLVQIQQEMDSDTELLQIEAQ